MSVRILIFKKRNFRRSGAQWTKMHFSTIIWCCIGKANWLNWQLLTTYVQWEEPLRKWTISWQNFKKSIEIFQMNILITISISEVTRNFLELPTLYYRQKWYCCLKNDLFFGYSRTLRINRQVYLISTDIHCATFTKLN